MDDDPRRQQNMKTAATLALAAIGMYVLFIFFAAQ